MHQNTYYRATLVGLLCLCYKEQHLITVNDEQIFAFIISKFGDWGLCLLMGLDEYQACSHLLLTGLLGSRSRVHIEEHGQNVRLWSEFTCSSLYVVYKNKWNNSFMPSKVKPQHHIAKTFFSQFIAILTIWLCLLINTMIRRKTR